MKIYEFHGANHATQKTAFFQEFLEKNSRGVEALKLPNPNHTNEACGSKPIGHPA
jgi:hypothetical protein